jgi:signal transduction histidine kinase
MPDLSQGAGLGASRRHSADFRPMDIFSIVINKLDDVIICRPSLGPPIPHAAQTARPFLPRRQVGGVGMTLDFETLNIVALLNTTILMVVFAGVLWAYRSFAATRYWLSSLALHATGTIVLTVGTAGGTDTTASFGSWLFAIAYCVAWQGVRVFFGRPPAWRMAVAIVVLSGLAMLALVDQARPAQGIAIALVQIVSVALIAFTVLRHPLRPGGLVVVGGAVLALAGNIGELSANLVRIAGVASAEPYLALAAWLYLAVTVGAGVCYVGFVLMAFDRLRTQQRDFAALVSHEFRAPLGVVAAAADNLSLAPAAGASDVRLRIARIQRTVKRMSMLIDNVFAGDRLDSWPTPFAATARFDLNDVLEAVETGSDSDAAGRVSFTYGGAAPVKGDRNLLEIAVLNLIQNALKYSAEGNPVTVRLSTDPGVARISVTDRGSGIPQDERERIFLKYYRVAGQTPSGSGLGLHISREIARQHGGELTLSASDPGGSTFCLSLPTDKRRA